MKKYSYSSSWFPQYQDESFGIEIPELREIIFPLQSLLSKMKSHIIHGKYTVMIGDDASGRIPALIINKVQNMCHTDVRTPLFFLAGSRKTKTIEAKKAEIKEFLKQKIHIPKSVTVLVVTEYIHHGGSLSLLTDVLRSCNIAYDVCTIGVMRSQSLTFLGEKLGRKILYGVKGKPALDGNYTLAGVCKSYEDLFATRYQMTKEERAIFLQGRKDVIRIAEFLHRNHFQS